MVAGLVLKYSRRISSIACHAKLPTRRSPARRASTSRVLSTSAGSQPGPAGDGDAPADHRQGAGAVGVGADDDLGSRIARHARVEIVEIETIDLAVDLERHAGGCCGRKHAVPCRACSGSRLRIRRPVGWPRTSTHGHSSARRRRSVICAGSWLNAECTEATTMSSWARQSSARSIVPSARMSHSMPASSVMPSRRAFDLADCAGVRQRRALRRGRSPSPATGCDR